MSKQDESQLVAPRNGLIIWVGIPYAIGGSWWIQTSHFIEVKLMTSFIFVSIDPRSYVLVGKPEDCVPARRKQYENAVLFTSHLLLRLTTTNRYPLFPSH